MIGFRKTLLLKNRPVVVLTYVALLLVLFSTPVNGCPSLGRGEGYGPGQPSQENTTDPQRRLNQQRMRENIATLRLVRMTKALDLTEEQAAKIFPVANRVEKEKMELNRQLGLEIRELRSLVAAEAPEESKIKEKIIKIAQFRESIRLKEAEFEAFLEKVLTPVQRARYVLFSLDFAQFLGQNIERVRALQRNKPQPNIKKNPQF
ncbi:MAG: hypothetical protein ACUVR0_05170 [Candidatus Aminicenantales bacterium]